MGVLTMSQKLPELRPGRYLIVEAFDRKALLGVDEGASRAAPMPESLIVFDNLGAGVGQLIAVSEGREATMPFHPDRVPIDAYCAAILDHVQLTAKVN